jgi:hypothetical protein
MGTWNFGEFIRFLQKCLKPLKIQGRFSFEFVPEFVTCNPGEFEVGLKRKVVPYVSNHRPTTFEYF